MEKEFFTQILDKCINDILKVSSWDELGETTKSIQFLVKSEDYQPTSSLAEAYENSLKHLIETVDVRPVESLFIAPILFKKCSYIIQHRPFWIHLHKTFLKINNEDQSDKILLHIVLATIVNAVLSNRAIALSRMVDILSAKSTGKLTDNENTLRYYGDLFAITGWFDGNSLNFKKQISDKWRHYNFIGTRDQVIRWLRIVSLLGFTESRFSSVDWVTFIFDTIIVNLLDKSLQTEQFNLALTIEKKSYSCYVNCLETAEFYENSYVKKIVPHFLLAGRKLRTTLPTVVSSQTNQELPKVCFFLHNHSFLAHTRNLFNYFKGLSQLALKPLQPILIIAFDFPSQDMLTLAKEYGVMVLHFEDITLGYFDRLLRIRQWCMENEISTLVGVCNLRTIALAFSMRIAPVQIHWSMKYHSVEFDEIDGYLTIGSFEQYRIINGKKWRAGHGALDPLYKSEFKYINRNSKVMLRLKEGN